MNEREQAPDTTIHRHKHRNRRPKNEMKRNETKNAHIRISQNNCVHGMASLYQMPNASVVMPFHSSK